MMVFVTAHALESYEEKCFDVGADGFLTKPCNVTTVDECLRRVLAKKNEKPVEASSSMQKMTGPGSETIAI